MTTTNFENTKKPEKQRKIERTVRSAAFYKKVFGELINSQKVRTVLDVGAGDSEFAEDAAQSGGPEVTRVDIDYDKDPPTGNNWVAGSATDLEQFHGQYDVVLSAFMMQHLSKEDQAKAIQEMISATTPRQSGSQSHEGYVGIYPVYRADKLRKVLSERGLYDVSRVSDISASSDVLVGREERYPSQFATLLIERNARLDEARQQELAQVIAESGALYRRTTMRDLARRAFMDPGVNRVAS